MLPDAPQRKGDRPDPRQGPFAPAFVTDDLGVAPYMTLLYANDEEEACAAIARIRPCLASQNAVDEVASLLASRNWRPQLVAAVAYLLDTDGAFDPALLWTAIDAGSAVTPKLVVAALFRDPRFIARASRRAEHDSAERLELVSSLVDVSPLSPALSRRVDEWRRDGRIGRLPGPSPSGNEGLRWAGTLRRCVKRQGIVLHAGG